jgi:DNA topoisomerase-1
MRFARRLFSGSMGAQQKEDPWPCFNEGDARSPNKERPEDLLAANLERLKTAEVIPDAVVEDPKQSAIAAGLRYVSDDPPGITRQRKGANFAFHGVEGRSIRNPVELKRIRSLAIPPAWNNVWICPHANGHLQATGTDVKGRKQYKYHPDWREVRDAAKYERVMAFARSLPEIRARVEEHLKLSTLCREKVLATLVKLLELSLIRIGNDEYAKANQSFGLTTMRNRHVEIAGSTLTFEFRGKSGKRHKIAVSDRRLAKIVRKCQELPGQRLFEYSDAQGKTVEIGSEDVNAYLQDISGQSFSAKDFRTWAGTVLAAIALGQMEAVDSKAAAKKNVVTAVEAVARMLGNTAAICKKCYIHPAVISKYMEGSLAQSLRVKADEELSQHLHELKPEEAAVLALLREELDRRSSPNASRSTRQKPK